MKKEYFDTALANNVFQGKYQFEIGEDWGQRCETVIEDVCGTQFGTQHPIMSEDERKFLAQKMAELKWIPGGRYVYYGGRKAKFYNNCYMLRGEEDSREEWAELAKRATSCLMTGGGIGIDYSRFRPSGKLLGRTGGQSSGPLPLMKTINEIGRNVMQGGSRRCLPWNTQVRTKDNIKRLCDLQPGDYVKTDNGYSKVVAKENTGEKDLLEIYTRAGLLVSTPEHRHAVIRNVDPFEVSWVRADELTDEDTLVFFNEYEEGAGNKELSPFPEFTPHHNSKPFTRPTQMSTDLAWFLGALCDAHCAERGLIFSQRESNIEYLHKVQRVLREVFDVPTRISEGHNTLEVRANRRQLSKDLVRYRSKNNASYIHQDILDASYQEKLAFIAGVLDADGSVVVSDSEREKGTYKFLFACSKDKTWIADFAQLLTSIGFPVRVLQGSRGDDSSREPLWRVQLADKDFSDWVAQELEPHCLKVRNHYQPVGFRKQAAHGLVVTRSGHNTPRVLNPMDFRSFEWPEGIIPAKVERVTPTDSDITYDIEVERDSCFVAGGHLTHNSAIYGSLNWLHEDVPDFLRMKNWHEIPVHEGYTLFDAKQDNFDFPAPLDMTNISLNYDDQFLKQAGIQYTDVDGTRAVDFTKMNLPETFIENCRQALQTGEPGFSFNFGNKQNETLRNACTEVVSEDDSDVCNLASINIGRIDSLEEFKEIVRVVSKFLVCGTVRGELPNEKVRQVREQNRRLGLGLMGVHEWLLKRGYNYEVPKELHNWLQVYKDESKRSADEHCDRLFLNRPVAYRAIAPTGSIGILASTTTGIEPIYAVAYKRRYLTDGNKWKYEYCVDHTADQLINKYGIDPDKVETANSLSKDPERRIKFQADIQDYVDNAISSTINLPAWGTQYNNENKVEDFAKSLAKYSPRLRGFTCYPDGARGGQPITEVSYEEALKHKNVVYEENDECKGGVCGV